MDFQDTPRGGNLHFLLGVHCSLTLWPRPARPSDRCRLAHCCLALGVCRKARASARDGWGVVSWPCPLTDTVGLVPGGETAHAELPGMRRHPHSPTHRPFADTPLAHPPQPHRHRQRHTPSPECLLPTQLQPHPTPHGQAAGSWLRFPRKRLHHPGTGVSGASSMCRTSPQSLPGTRAAGGHSWIQRCLVRQGGQHQGHWG